MRRTVFCLAALVLLLAGCACAQPVETTASTEPPTVQTLPTVPATQPTATEIASPDSVQELVDAMTLEAQVGQLFLVRCPEVNVAETITQFQPGGILLFGRDFDGETPESMTRLIASYQAMAETPMLMAVDEEGGVVCRVSSHSAFRSQRFASIRELYNSGGLDAIRQTEQEKCQLLRQLGIQVNMAPVCDISTEPSAFLYSRSLGQSPDSTAQAVETMVSVMAQEQIGSVLKHFPGYGNNADTHIGTAVDERSYEQFQQGEFLVFAAGIEAGCGAVLVSHNVVQCMDAERPASLSAAVHEILREELGFTGVIMTDDLAMDAIDQQYEPGEAAVLAVQAGNDLLCVSELTEPYQAVLDAVKAGDISRQQLANSVYRILAWKQALGLLETE